MLHDHTPDRQTVPWRAEELADSSYQWKADENSFITTMLSRGAPLVEVDARMFVTSRDASATLANLWGLSQSGVEYHLRKQAALGALRSYKLHPRCTLYACCDLFSLTRMQQR